jgi:hypothetical protein
MAEFGLGMGSLLPMGPLGMVAVFSATARLRQTVQGRIPAADHVFHHVEIGSSAIDVSRLLPLHG